MPDPTPTTPAQGTEPDAGADERVSALVGKHLKTHLGKALEEALTPHLASLREQLAPKVDPKAAPAPAGGAADVAGRLADLQTQLDKEREARASERQQAREADAFGALRAELGGKVKPEAVDVVAKLLFHAERVVKVDKLGKVSVHLEDEEFTLADGVAKWLKTPGADLFKPAPGYGSGPKKTPPRAPAPARGAAPTGAREGREDPLQKTLRDLDRLRG